MYDNMAAQRRACEGGATALYSARMMMNGGGACDHMIRGVWNLAV